MAFSDHCCLLSDVFAMLRLSSAVDDVLADLEKVCRMISSESFTSATASAITSLSFHMKMMGHQLEGICKGRLYAWILD